MNTTAQNATKYGMAASRKWYSDARELTVSFDRSLEDSIVAFIKLNFRDEVAQTAPSIEFYYSLMSKSFLSLYDAETINPVYPVTDLGQAFIDEIRGATGIGAQAVPAPPPVLSPEQVLEKEVKSDWKTLPSKAIKAKMQNNRLYRECVERVAGQLESVATAHVIDPGF